ncbi:MAG: SH3 domain-containing protein [Planctomycetes bacterium]|nr:SH3 domain-containing protein [Planctomycetota bacterium]
MKFTTPLLLLAIATTSSSALAQDWALKLEDNQGELKGQIRNGRAELVLGANPTLTLRATGEPVRPLKGIAVFGGYLFTDDFADLMAVMPKSRGMVAALSSVSQVTQAETLVAGLRVRSEPSRSGRVVANLRGGQRVEVLEQRDGWARVKLLGKEGWAKISGSSRDFLRLISVPKLTSVQGARSVFLYSRGPGWQGLLRNGDTWSGDIVLRNDTHAAPTNKRLLVLADLRHMTDGGAFKAYANQLKKTYGQQGYQTVIADVDSFEDSIDELNAASEAPYARVVLIGHGGWDGPVLRSHVGTRQVSGKYNVEVFERFVAAVNAGTTPTARIYNSSCHAAGTARSEKAPWSSPYRWVHDLAKRTGRHVAGPAGKTSTEWTRQQSLATLEGQGVVVQEVHVARGDKLRILYSGMNLASAKSRPLPEIEDLPQPESADDDEQPIATTASGGGAASPQPLPSATIDLTLPTNAGGQPALGRRLGQ